MNTAPEHSSSSHLNSLRTFLILVPCLVLTYCPVFLFPYAYNDELLFFNPEGMRGLIMMHLGIGRFGFLIIGTILSALVKTMAALDAARLFNILQLSLAGALLVPRLRRVLRHELPAFLGTLALLTLPAFQSMVSSVMATSVLTTILLAFAVFHFLEQIPIDQPPVSRWKSKYAFWATGLLFLMYCTYPSGASFYWALAAWALIGQWGDPLQQIRERAFNTFLVGLTAIVLYAFSLEIINSSAVVFTNTIYNTSVVTPDPSHKILWFFREPMNNVLNLWNIFPNLPQALITAGILVGAILLSAAKIPPQQKKEIRGKALYAGVLLPVFLLLSFLPNLLAAYNAAWYRCLGGVTITIGLGLLWALQIWTDLVPGRFKKKVFLGMLALLCLYGMTQAFGTVLRYRALPSFLEIRYLKNTFKDVDLSQYSGLLLIVPPLDQLRYHNDEFGTISSNIPGNTGNLVSGVLAILGRQEEARKLKFKYLDTAPPPSLCFPKDMYVVNLRPLVDSFPDYLLRPQSPPLSRSP